MCVVANVCDVCVCVWCQRDYLYSFLKAHNKHNYVADKAPPIARQTLTQHLKRGHTTFSAVGYAVGVFRVGTVHAHDTDSSMHMQLHAYATQHTSSRTHLTVLQAVVGPIEVQFNDRLPSLCAHVSKGTHKLSSTIVHQVVYLSVLADGMTHQALHLRTNKRRFLILDLGTRKSKSRDITRPDPLRECYTGKETLSQCLSRYCVSVH